MGAVSRCFRLLFKLIVQLGVLLGFLASLMELVCAYLKAIFVRANHHTCLAFYARSKSHEPNHLTLLALQFTRWYTGLDSVPLTDCVKKRTTGGTMDTEDAESALQVACIDAALVYVFRTLCTRRAKSGHASGLCCTARRTWRWLVAHVPRLINPCYARKEHIDTGKLATIVIAMMNTGKCFDTVMDGIPMHGMWHYGPLAWFGWLTRTTVSVHNSNVTSAIYAMFEPMRAVAVATGDALVVAWVEELTRFALNPLLVFPIDPAVLCVVDLKDPYEMQKCTAADLDASVDYFGDNPKYSHPAANGMKKDGTLPSMVAFLHRKRTPKLQSLTFKIPPFYAVLAQANRLFRFIGRNTRRVLSTGFAVAATMILVVLLGKLAMAMVWY